MLPDLTYHTRRYVMNNQVRGVNRYQRPFLAVLMLMLFMLLANEPHAQAGEHEYPEKGGQGCLNAEHHRQEAS